MSGVSFRPLARSDFALLRGWLETPHVARWWHHDTSVESLESDFGPSLDGTDPARLAVALAEGVPFGFLQSYRYADNPGYLADVSTIVEVPQGALSIDYFVGEPALLRRGWGLAMIGAAVASLRRDEAGMPAIIVPINAANIASRRLLERAGFRAVAQGLLAPDNPADGPEHVLYRIDR